MMKALKEAVGVTGNERGYGMETSVKLTLTSVWLLHDHVMLSYSQLSQRINELAY